MNWGTWISCLGNRGVSLSLAGSRYKYVQISLSLKSKSIAPALLPHGVLRNILVDGCTHLPRHRNVLSDGWTNIPCNIPADGCTNIHRNILPVGCTNIPRNILVDGCTNIYNLRPYLGNIFLFKITTFFNFMAMILATYLKKNNIIIRFAAYIQ